MILNSLFATAQVARLATLGISSVEELLARASDEAAVARLALFLELPTQTIAQALQRAREAPTGFDSYVEQRKADPEFKRDYEAERQKLRDPTDPAPEQCVHGGRLYGDSCEQCWDVEMTCWHCRRCGGESYYESDFQHKEGCPIEQVRPHKLPNWRQVPNGHARRD